MLQKQLFILGLVLSLFFSFPGVSQAAFTITGSNAATGAATVAMPITDLQLSGSGTEPIPVKLRVTSGTLSMSTTTGLTFTGSSSGATLYFSGTLANINTALATLTYTRASAGSDTLEVSLVESGEVFFADNGHLYKFITGSITANGALAAADDLTAYGSTGYLATITSQAENDFVAARLQGDGWMAASDAGVEDTWKWIAGPEANTTFWSGRSNGATVGGNYANWASGEPNDYGSGEDCGQFYISTGKWNDLPCSGHTLSGYVVEFGAPGDLPNVPAKNIALTTQSSPVVSSFTPADNATNRAVDTNLTLVFNRTVYKGTGSILLKKSSDNSTIETIDVTSGLVTGQGTNTITINPNTTLEESTSYYITIANTAFKDVDEIAFLGISTTTTWNFTTGDFTSPVITNVQSSSIASNSATITWTTNENASTRVYYGPTSTYGTNTAEADTSSRVLSHTATLSGLLSCTKYHFSVNSRDASTNSTTSSDNTFTTTACAANTTPTNATSSAVPANSRGSTSLTEEKAEITVTTPSNFTNEADSVVIQIKSLASEGVFTNLGKPTAVPKEVGGTVFDVKAIINGTTELDSFDIPVTIEYQYSDDDIVGIDESSIWLYHYHNNAWVALDDCTVNTTTNNISCTTDGFSIFGLFGKAPASANSTSHSGSGTPSTECQTQPPGEKAPWLYAAVPKSATSVLLYFASASDPVDHYALEYGLSSGSYRFGATNIGGRELRTYEVNSLTPFTTYYFRVRAQNGCAAGPWSNEISVKTGMLATTNTLQFLQSEVVPAEENTDQENSEESEKNNENSAQKEGYDVTVKILNEQSAPVAGASVILHSTPREAYTDENGIAHFNNVEPGQHTVLVAYGNYKGEQALHLEGDTKHLYLNVTVQQQNMKISPLVYGLLGSMFVLILFLLFLLLATRKKRKSK